MTSIPIPAARRTLASLALSVTALLASAQEAKAGYGTVTYVAKTTNSITVRASGPSTWRIRYATGASRYRICFKKTWTWGSACSANTRFSNSNPYAITGLTAGTNYKIKVYAWTERYSWGKWRNRKYRLVGTTTIRTLDTTPTGSLHYDGWQPGSFGFGTLTGHVNWSDPANFDLIQIGYKKRGTFHNLSGTLKVRGRPLTNWGTACDEERGWSSFNPTNLKSNYGLACALQCSKYRIGAYAFRIGSNEGIKIDIITVRSGGNCASNKSALGVVGQDHSNLVQAWAEKLRAHYKTTRVGTLRAALVRDYPAFAKRLPVIEADNDLGQSEYELLSFIVEHEEELLQSFEKQLAPLGLSLEQQIPASLRASIEDDVDSPPTRALPRFAQNVHQSGSSALPLGQTRGLLQSWYAGSTLTNTTITELGWRATQGAIAPATTHRLEVVLGNTSLPAKQLSRDFARNLQAARTTTFFPSGRVSLPALVGSSDPNRAMVWIKGQRPFVFAGPNLLVQTRTETSQIGMSLRGRAVQAVESTSTGAMMHRYGWSCAGSLDIDYTPGAATLTASAVAPGYPVLFMLGFDNTKFAGVVPLPMALDAFGMAECQLLVDPILQVSTVAGRGGVARLQVPIDASIRDLELHGQALHVQPQRSSVGFATTGAVQLVLGASLCNEVASNAPRASQADRGPYQANRGVVLLVR